MISTNPYEPWVPRTPASKQFPHSFWENNDPADLDGPIDSMSQTQLATTKVGRWRLRILWQNKLKRGP